MEQETGQGSKKWVWVVVILVVLLGGGAVWYFTKGNDKTSEETTSNNAVYTPKHEDWTVYRSEKYSYNMSFPTDYLLTESADKGISLAKGDKVMVEMYAYNDALIDSTVALYSDDSKGYMTGGQKSSVTVAGTTGTKLTGTYGKNGGMKMIHEGVKGSVTIFVQKGRTYVLNSYDAGDAAAQTIFDDIAADIVF